MRTRTLTALALVGLIVALIGSISTSPAAPPNGTVLAAGVSAPAPAQFLVGDYKIARGTITLDGTNPSSATTGLVTIVSCAVTQKTNATPGDDPTYFTTFTSAVAGRLDVYAWKNTGGTDPTLVASTDSDDLVDWICLGT